MNSLPPCRRSLGVLVPWPFHPSFSLPHCLCGHLHLGEDGCALPISGGTGILRSFPREVSSMPDTRAASPSHGGPVQIFYAKKGAPRRPTVARAEGIYMW